MKEAQFVASIQRHTAKKRWPQGAVNRLAVTVKDKTDDSRKRRIIVDGFRSGGNERQRPPAADPAQGGRHHRGRAQHLQGLGPDLGAKEPVLNFRGVSPSDQNAEEEGMEQAARDFTDAYCHATRGTKS